MKKMLLGLALMLMPLTAPAYETVKTMKELQMAAMAVKPLDILMVVLVKDAKKQKAMGKVLAAYEAKHANEESPVTAIMALRKNKEIEEVVTQFGGGPKNDPVVIVFVSGRPIGKFEGVPNNEEVIADALAPLKKALHDYKEQLKNPPVEVTVPENSPTPTPNQ